MGHITRTIAASAAGLVLTAGLTGTAYAGGATPDRAEPCAAQTEHVARAKGALVRVTAAVEHWHVAVADAQAAVAAAATPREKAFAKKLLRVARAAELKAEKVEKAQRQRVAKAQARLDQCLAEQPPTDEPPAADPPVVP